ncbi:hypothetical protein PTSG_02510 [Salpingoeca rosetta]|uniref:Rhodanese domain-containing protein n=1 Tax=Salpingoeca rosetta (strain ATCC 50818 / BSB-021) TaxID=946362 RepID=F2U2E6_SALR5|nr:uncharacterized protein PTSG_02510 [Salpingoeca rosetta]EGD81798.1 hypothetical protein PTSG_02510 [Salpingoeca rosetta]|eukprot:XP_004997002.1 hypothetical protein PTSG_02510 [Salpingoeca rosetta]
MTSRKPKTSALDKKVPRNPKFKNVRSRIDTGSSMSKHQERVDYVKKHFKYRKDEIFRRIKATTLVQLIVEVEESKLQQDVDEDDLDEAATFQPQPPTGFQEPVGQPPMPASRPDTSAAQSNATMNSTASSFLSVITGVGELQQAERTTRRPVDTSRPYLIIDARSSDDYEACHVVGAKSFPYTRLSRATNMLTPELLAYKNKEGCVIVVYDEDESVAPRVATSLVQHGIDNLFMLSGGLRVLSHKFPDGLIVGDLPASCRPKKGDMATHAHRVVLGSLTPDNLEVVRQQLETNLLADDASSTASSRTSRTTSTARRGAPASKPGTAASTRTTRSSRSTRTTPSKTTWK